MNPRWLASLALLALIAGCAVPARPPETSNPYVDLHGSSIRGLSQEEIDGLRKGEGMQYALAAELNGYPGPKHILDLDAELELAAEQRAEVRALYEETVEEARRVGEELLDAYQRMDQLFRSGEAEQDETLIDDLAIEISAAEGELRSIHLRAHLHAYPILTEEQRAEYMQLRGYSHSTQQH